MSEFNKRTVGPLTISWEDDRYVILFNGKKFHVARDKARLLWILAEYPDQMIPRLYVYREMYGFLPASERPHYRILQVYASQLRSKMHAAGDLSSKDTYLRSNYQGGMGLFSTPAPLPLHEKRSRKGKIVQKLLAAQKK